MSNQIEAEEAKFPPLPKYEPGIRKPTGNKISINPLEGIDFEKIPTKEQAFLLGFINGQRNIRR